MPLNIPRLVSYPYAFYHSIHVIFTASSPVIGINNKYQLREIEKRAKKRERDMVGMHMDLVKGYGSGLYEGECVKRVMCFEVLKGKGADNEEKEEDVRGEGGGMEGGVRRNGGERETTRRERMGEFRGGARGEKRVMKKEEGKNNVKLKGMEQVDVKVSAEMEYIEGMMVIYASKPPADKKSVGIMIKGGVWDESENTWRPVDNKDSRVKKGKEGCGK